MIFYVTFNTNSLRYAYSLYSKLYFPFVLSNFQYELYYAWFSNPDIGLPNVNK